MAGRQRRELFPTPDEVSTVANQDRIKALL
jgi:hypothetical protein